MAFTLPTKGIVFWPVGTGDSTTVCVDADNVIQIDLHHLVAADDDEDPREPIVDRLVKFLPKRDKKPYLAVFVLTHPDKDHCLGFNELREKVTIGEIWFTPRIFFEHKGDLCDDAQDFMKEAKRRVKKVIEKKGAVESGDYVRIIGYHSLLEEDEYKGFPEDLITRPGNSITGFDGEDRPDLFDAFVHAPIREDEGDQERNETSVGLRVEVKEGDHTGQALLLGDLSYPSIRRIFDETKNHGNDDKLNWDVFLAPHHCSKSVMYFKDEGEEEATLKQDILDDIEAAAEEIGFIIASCDPIPSKNEHGDNPPHAKAKQRYEEIAPNGFLCTGEHPNEKNPQPIVFEVTAEGFVYQEPSDDDDGDTKAASESKATRLASAIVAGSGQPSTPTERVGFGKHS
ncbi:MAG: ComEC/Rec2 family competence protein [Pirellulaceae bacterium]